MSNGNRGLVFGINAEIGVQDHQGNCWENNSTSDLLHASPNIELVRRSQFRIRCQGEGNNNNNACGCDAIVSVPPGVAISDLLEQQPFGDTETCRQIDLGDEEKGLLCDTQTSAPPSETPIDPEFLSDRLQGLVYTEDNASTLNWMSQFNLLRAIDDGLLTTNGQSSEISQFRSQNVELDMHLQFWNDLSTLSIGSAQNAELATLFNEIHQVKLELYESTNEAEKTDLQNQLDHLQAEFGSARLEAKAMYHTNQETLQGIYNNYSFNENVDELHLYYMAFVSNLYINYVQDNSLELDDDDIQLLHTIGTTCLDQAGPATNLAKALYYLVSDGIVLDSEACSNQVDERTQERKDLQQMQIFPNPTLGTIHIKVLEDTDIEIINQMGMVLKIFSLQSGTNIIDLALPAGVYFVRDGKNVNEKLLITK